jgi:hypothetical protein
MAFLCHNPCFGLGTKARLARVQDKKEAQETHLTPENAKKWEKMNPHTPKATLTWGVGIHQDSQIFKEQLQGSKPIRLTSFLYHWKDFET